MTISYQHRTSVIHALRADVKFLGLLAAGSLLFLCETLWLAVAALGLTLGLCLLSKIDLRYFVKVLAASAVIFALLFAFQLYANGTLIALIVCCRLATLMLLGVLLTVTTRVTDMLAVFRRTFGWLGRFGVDVEKLSLGIALAIRFVPLIADITREVREAQAARGLENNVFAVAMPVLHRTLKMADDIADAIDARS